MGMKSVALPPQLHDYAHALERKVQVIGETRGSQTLTGRVNIAVQAQSITYRPPDAEQENTERRIVHVDLDGTVMGAGRGKVLNDPDMKGFFVEAIRYQVWLQSTADAPNPAKAFSGWRIEKESPSTSNMTGSVSSSIHWGLNASTGMFGDTPTANAGGSFGVSSSHSHTLNDFTFLQHSTSTILDQEIRMSMCGDGTPYSTRDDLVDMGGYFDLLHPHILRPLPGLAISNVPVVGQAVFMNHVDEDLVEKLRVCVALRPRWILMQVKTTDNFAHVPLFHAEASWNPLILHSVDVDFGLLK